MPSLRPRFFRYGINTDANRDSVECRKHVPFVFRRFHLAGTKRCPCKRVKGQEDPFVHIFIEIEGGVILVFYGKILCRISRFNYSLLLHHFTIIIPPVIHRISGFILTSDTNGKKTGIPAA